MLKSVKEKLKPKGEVPKEFKERLWLEIVLLALSAPASLTFFFFHLRPVASSLLFSSLFLIVDGLRLYYYGYLGHYQILSGSCIDVIQHKRLRRHYTEVVFECGGQVFSTWTSKEISVSEECSITAIVSAKYLFTERDGIRQISTIFLKVTGSEKLDQKG